MKYQILSFLIIFGTLSCSKDKKETQTTFESFPVVSPQLVDTTLAVDYVAEISAIQNVEIRTRIKGYLDKIYIDEGKYVKEGQLLFSIHNPELNEEVAKAGAVLKSTISELKSAEIEFQNIKRLVEKNVVSNTELEAAKNKVEMMKAKVEEAKANESFAKIQLSYTQIKAPFSGIVSRIPYKIGSLVEDGTLLTSISNNGQVFAYFDVSEKEYLNYSMKLKENAHNPNNVTLILANGEPHPVKGKIETTEGEIDKNTGNIAFRARFDNPNMILKHGASGKVRLMEKYKNALLIPQKATFEIQDRIYVYVVDANNKVKSKEITTKNRLTHYYILDSGLSEKDKIIYEGIQEVKEGMSIKPELVDTNELSKELTYTDTHE